MLQLSGAARSGVHIENSYIMGKLKSVGHSSDFIGRGQKVTRILCPTPHAAVPGGIFVNGWPRDAARCPGRRQVPFIAILKKMVRLGQKIATLVFIAWLFSIW